MIKSKYLNFIDSIDSHIFRCPLCFSEQELINKSIVCENKHTFNINKKGFVNFEPNKHLKNYDEKLFKARYQILSKDYYNDLKEELTKLLFKYDIKNKVVVDMGCGEGSFLQAVGVIKNNYYGLDLSLDAIKVAKTNYPNLNLLVADLANIPFKDSSIDVILDILTPANYLEFKRVLKEDGFLIKVLPGEKYFKEIKELLMFNKKSNDNVIGHLEKYMDIIQEINVNRTVKIQPVDVDSILLMSPLTWNLTFNEREVLKSKFINEITIDLSIVIAKMK